MILRASPRMRAWLLPGIGVLALAGLALVAHAERPFDTEDAVPLDPGRLQAEVGASYSRGPSDVDFGTFTGLLTLGVVPGLDVAVQGGEAVGEVGANRRVRGGVTDVQLQSKWLVLPEAPSRPAILLSPIVRLPTAREPFGLDGVDVQALGVVSKTFGPATLMGNVGYTFATEQPARDGWTLDLANLWALDPVWSVGGEIVSTLGRGRLGDLAFMRGGVIWTVAPGVVLDGSVSWKVHGSLPDVSCMVGATIDIF